MTPFDSPDFAAHESVHFFTDPASGLEAVIAIHSTARGPATGGCRFWGYASRDAALTDALRLARGMSYKNALAGLPLGGGKAVVLKPAGDFDRSALFAAFGRAVDSLAGRYVTAEDVGTTVADMRAIAEHTCYVGGFGGVGNVAGGDPAPSTAWGVFLGIRAAWSYLRGEPAGALAGVRVAVQGLGGVGLHLCRHLHAAGARLVVSDLDAERVARAVAEFDATALAPAKILTADVDILSPCALGAVLNEASIPTIRAALVAGAANNQLATEADGERLRRRGILYAPDYVINAGGIIRVACEYLRQGTESDVRAQIARIPDTLRQVLEQAAQDALPTHVVADRLAERALCAPGALPPRRELPRLHHAIR
jgi:leucine dehydrogenase